MSGLIECCTVDILLLGLYFGSVVRYGHSADFGFFWILEDIFGVLYTFYLII